MTVWRKGIAVDETPIHRKLGYQRMIEIGAHRERIKAATGLSGERLEAAARDAYDEAHRNDPTYRETSAAFAARFPKPPPPVLFTPEELALIAERFAGANDPVGQAIERKAARL